jgi:hypothetical protein
VVLRLTMAVRKGEGEELLYLEFGKEEHRVFPADLDYANQIANALRMRGWSDISSANDAPDGWMTSSGGIAVYAKLAKGGESLYFTAPSAGTTQKVIDALEMAKPGIQLRTEGFDAPE